MFGRGKRKNPFGGGGGTPLRIDAAALAAIRRQAHSGAAASSGQTSGPRTSPADAGVLACLPRPGVPGPGASAPSVPQGPSARRDDAPAVRAYARGQADKAVAIARDPRAVAAATAAFTKQIYAKTTVAPREARQRRWEEVAGAMSFDPYDLTPKLLLETMAVLWAADYRTTVMIAEQAKAEFLARDGVWTGALARTFRDATRAAERGLGPQRHTAAFPMGRIEELPSSMAPRCQGGPVHPRRVDTIACWWLFREIEAGNATVGDVTIEGGCKASVNLPASKADPAAIGVCRSHKCACGRRSSDPAVLSEVMCPACSIIDQVDWVKAEFGVSPDLPLFPTASGDFTTKIKMVEHIKAGAGLLGLPLLGHAGAELWGGHAWRRGGAIWLAQAGVEIWRIQALARHSSCAILRYVEGAHVLAMSGIAAEAAVGRSLVAVRAELEALRAQLPDDRGPRDELLKPEPGGNALVPLAIEDVAQPPPPPPSGAPGPSGGAPATRLSYVSSTRRGGRVHTVDAGHGGLTLCGWLFQFTTHFVVSTSTKGPPHLPGTPRCARCARGEAGVGGQSSSSDSDEAVALHNLASGSGSSAGDA